MKQREHSLLLLLGPRIHYSKVLTINLEGISWENLCSSSSISMLQRSVNFMLLNSNWIEWTDKEGPLEKNNTAYLVLATNGSIDTYFCFVLRNPYQLPIPQLNCWTNFINQICWFTCAHAISYLYTHLYHLIQGNEIVWNEAHLLKGVSELSSVVLLA